MTAEQTEIRIAAARVSMAHIDAIMEGPVVEREPRLHLLKEQFDRLSQSTAADKTELNWPHVADIKHVSAAAGLFVTENVANLLGAGRGVIPAAVSDQHSRVTQTPACESTKV